MSLSSTTTPSNLENRFRALLDSLREQRPNADLGLVERAYRYAEELHRGQVRKSGEPYILHPLEVARITAELHMDDETVAAALLHDVVEDTAAEGSEIERRFGPAVRAMVEGVTKLKLDVPTGATDRQRAAAETHRKAESLRRMFLAMAEDVRVMVIKLADRLHNMRTLDALQGPSQTRIANETLDIYAPLAARLGIWQMKWQLEDLAFKVLHPAEFREITDLVAKTRAERELELQEAMRILRDELAQQGLPDVEIHGRPKHLYSIFNKMVKQGVPFEEIHDLIAVRVITQETPECYLVLGVVHEQWQPLPGLFSDYIASPKPNGYQSLHTKVVGPGGGPIEVQIRTRKMHEVAELGIAAHWSYKEGQARRDSFPKYADLRQQLLDVAHENREAREFIRSLSSVFGEQVYVFTPKGDVVDLPQGSSPIDFAFRIHTNLGVTLVGCRVNGRMVPLGTTLQTGDVVEVVTRSNAQPSLDWVKFAKSSHARSKIKGWFRKHHKDQYVAQGRDLLDRELKHFGLDPRQYIGEDKLQEVASSFGIESAEDLLASVGEGIRSVRSVVHRLRGTVPEKAEEGLTLQKAREEAPTRIDLGVENMMIKRAKCCLPIPGDEVVGYVTRGKGLMIHRKVCPNALRLQETDPERLQRVLWDEDGGAYAVNLTIMCLNRQGLLMDISTVFGESKTNVVSANIRTLPNHTAEIDVVIELTGTAHLQALLNKIGALPDVLNTLRVFGRTAVR